ncbi:MAG TPA: EpsI family protein [Candidatus Saccharimonadales bacterium]|nr:EpsI family protein [Candidatus Saccharimonadales bacterium]
MSARPAPALVRPALVGAWLLVAVAGTYARMLRSHEVPPPNQAHLDRIPAAASAWIGTDVRFDPRIYQVLSADTTLMRLYRAPETGSELWLFVAYFRGQRTGAQIHSPKNCLPGGGWNIVSSEEVRMPLGDRQLAANRFLIARGREQQVVYYWFMTRAGVIRNEYVLKLDLVRNALLRRPTDAAFVRLSSPVVAGDLAETDRQMVRFVALLSPGLLEALPFPAREAF